MTEHALRFGVVGQPGYRAESWKCWTNTGQDKRDFYLSNRAVKAIKLSFHETGDWRFAYTSREFFNEENIPPNRLLNKYLQPLPHAEGLILACRIHIPYHAVNIPDSQLDPSVYWIPCAPSGYSIEFAIILSEWFDPEDWPGRQSMRTQVVGSIPLERSGRLWVVYHTVPSIQPTLPAVSNPQYFKGMSEHELLNNEANRALMWGVNDDGSIVIMESPIIVKKSSEN
jgi:hypothetical protein